MHLLATKLNIFIFRNLYCSDQQNDLSFESKENVDISNINISNQNMDSSFKSNNVSNEDIFIFNSSENSVNSVRNRYNKDKLVYEGPRIEDEADLDIVSNLNWRGKAIKESPVWCMDFCNDLIILGCADGRLEFWEASSGKLMVNVFYLTNIFLYFLLPLEQSHNFKCSISLNLR